jgi:hypothetical protein
MSNGKLAESLLRTAARSEGNRQQLSQGESAFSAQSIVLALTKLAIPKVSYKL